MKSWCYKGLALSLLFMLLGCANYYQAHLDFNSEFEQGDLKRALETLGKHQEESTGKNRFVYFVNKGLLLSILGQYEESNNIFEKAYLFGEDFRVNYVAEAASYFTNPTVTVYRGEDHEHLMLLYFKAINFLKLNRPDDALVECRRLNIRLNQLADKYSSPDKLKRNAFIHTLMGIIYQSSGDHNNAFIAYRNAVEIYETDYARLFGLKTPDQLKRDLLSAAWRTGFKDEYDAFSKKFGMTDFVVQPVESSLVFFWHNGLAPVKAEWSVNFMISPGASNAMIFGNEPLNLSFPFRVENEKDRNNLAMLRIFRVAFPKYYERPAYFQSADITCNDSTYRLEVADDISKIAVQSLKQRMFEEFSKGLLRAALKKATEESLRKEDERLGAVLGLVNALTEKADTRNWQTLPHSIYYARVPLKEGVNSIVLTLGAEKKVNYDFTYQAKKGQTLFHTFSSLETGPGFTNY